MLRAAKELINENNRELIGNSFHPLNESEFSGYITNALVSTPDVLVFLNFGQQTSESLRTAVNFGAQQKCVVAVVWRSEEHTSELQSLMRYSYAVFCLIKNNTTIY